MICDKVLDACFECNKFTVPIKRIDFEVPNNLGNQYNKDYQSFLQKRFDILNMDYKFLNLLTSSLLLSAIPFHSENKERQLVMFSKSLEMVSDY